jgi:hypothetical protein
LVTPLTVHVTVVLLVFDTAAVTGNVAFTFNVCEDVGVVMETATGAMTDTLTEADLVLSATLVAVMLNVAGDGTAAGAV